MTALLTRAAMAPARRPVRRRRLAGLALIALVAALPVTCVAVYTGVFSGAAIVTVRAERAGSMLASGADVRLRGVLVGSVRTVTTNGSGATVLLALDQAQLPGIPGNVLARLLPRSVVGERFVELVAPGGPAAPPIRPGAVISRDRSSTAVEVERVLDVLLPVLRAVDPAKLAVTLNALAMALDGRGAQLGASLASLGPYLAALTAELPSAALGSLATTAGVYADAAPQLAQTLRHLGDASSALVRQRAQLAAFVAATTSVASRGAGLLSVQGGRLVQLAEVARPTAEVLARYAPEFGCLLRGLTDLRPRLDSAFGGGDLRVTLELSPGQGVAQPRNPADPGPDCHGLPRPGQGAGGGGAAMGEAGTAGERAVVGAVLGRTPDITTLLVGPLARGSVR